MLSATSTIGLGSAFDSASGKVVIAHRDGGDTNKGKAVAGTAVSATEIIVKG